MGYQTEQKKALVNFLTEHHTKQYTIDEIVAQMTARSMRDDDFRMPGKSTVYRLISQLVEDGSVKRFVKGNSRQFLYQAMDGDDCKLHFHLKCTECGRMVHLDAQFSQKIEQMIADEFAFEVDESRTMMFGLCKMCSKAGKGGANGREIPQAEG